MAGLQGVGKTTTVGKLAKYLKEEKKKKVLTVSADVYRPAAIAQLESVTKQVGADFFPSTATDKPVDIALAALDWAKKHYHDVLIIDTAGRLGIDEAMMQEIAAVHAAVKPIETLFVVDAMLGQDAINTAKAFNDALPLTGIVLTKLDGDSRGGAALSVRHITGKPIKFAGVSEKLDGLEAFDAQRMANRILGMGDILALVEEARKGVDMQGRGRPGQQDQGRRQFDMNDFKSQLAQMKKMGGMASLIDKLPAQFQQAAGGANMDQADKQVRRMVGIIDSMTPAERAKPELIKATRKRRIAAGAGVQVQEVNRMLAQYDQMQTHDEKAQRRRHDEDDARDEGHDAGHALSALRHRHVSRGRRETRRRAAFFMPYSTLRGPLAHVSGVFASENGKKFRKTLASTVKPHQYKPCDQLRNFPCVR